MGRHGVGLFAHHQNHPLEIKEMVFFKGTGALSKGTGVFYTPDYYTALTGEAVTDAWGKRDMVVDVPTKITADRYFAGVVLEDYDANANGQWIEIACPGSVCKVYVNEAVTIGDVVTVIIGGDDVGQFTEEAVCEVGYGCAIIEQSGDADTMVQARLVDYGPQGCSVEKIAEIGTGAVTFSLFGVSAIAADTLASDATYTLANGKFVGHRKGFYLEGALTTQDLLVTVTAGIQADDSTALASFEMDGSGDLTILEWVGDKWKVVHNTGSTLNAS